MYYTKLRINWKVLVLLTTFLLCYFYYDYTDLRPKIIRFSLIGIIESAVAFIVFARFSVILKYILGVSLCTLIFITPLLWNKNRNLNAPIGLMGLWDTDSSDGYIIHLNVKEDSAYLSQSSINLVKSFKLSVLNDSLELGNGNKHLIYKYKLLNRGNQLILHNQSDSLFFKKVK
jgi:hypothetical protein